MTELLQLAFSPINVVFTVLLISVVLYWITVVLGIFDSDLFHVDLPDPGVHIDMDADMDFHVETDAGADFHAETNADLDTGVVWGLAHWFYVGEVPVMVLVSLFILSLWTGAMLGNYYFNPAGSWLRAFAVFNVNWVLGLVVVKLVAAPLRPLYAVMNRDFNAAPKVLGSQCRVITRQVTPNQLGQAEVATKGAPLILNVRAQENREFKKDDVAVVVNKDKETGVYTIGPMKDT
jgi:hypothetical protein